MKEFDLGALLPPEPVRTKEDLVVGLILNPPDIITDATQPLQDRRRWGDEDPVFTFEAFSRCINLIREPLFNPDITKRFASPPQVVTTLDNPSFFGVKYRRDTTELFSDNVALGRDMLYFPPTENNETSFTPTRTIGLRALVENDTGIVLFGVEVTKFWRELDDANINVYKVSQQPVKSSDLSVNVFVGAPEWGNYDVQKIAKSFGMPQSAY